MEDGGRTVVGRWSEGGTIVVDEGRGRPCELAFIASGYNINSDPLREPFHRHIVPLPDHRPTLRQYNVRTIRIPSSPYIYLRLLGPMTRRMQLLDVRS